jgi:hypothetical protein
MDPNPLGPSFGSIIIGLILVMALATAIFLVGAWAVAQFRRGRVEEETDISYPDVPQSADDRRAVAKVYDRERASGGVTSDTATDMELREQAVGQPVRQSPTRAERPADAEHDRGVAPREDRVGPSAAGDEHSGRSPL